MHAPSTTSSCASTDRFSPGNSSRGPRTSAISAGTRAVAGSPRHGRGDKAKHPCAMAAPMSDVQVEALGKDVVDWYVRQNPIFATYIGIHDHDHLLPKGTYEAEIEECERVKEFLRTLEAIDRKTLSPSKRVDWGVLRNAFRLWIFQSEGIGIWKSKPAASDAVGDSLFPLFMRSFAPLAKRLGSIVGRLDRSPAYIEQTKDRIRTPGRMWSEIAREANEIVKSDHPQRFDGALEYTAKAMADAKRFIAEHDLATLPPDEELNVIETPSYLRHVIPFAAYNAPARFETRKQGFYMVTPVEDKPEMLREHSYAGTRTTAVHEGYPGHHLQLSCASLNPSYARIFGDAVETVEGWAHYCEDMMKEAGFSADPKTKFVQMTDQIWRACRIIIDVDLHSGKMGFDEAVDLLVRESGMERSGADAEVKRYTYNPAYQLSYLIGKHLILELRKDVKKGLGKKYSEKLVHDTILYAGSLPMKYVREILEHKEKELRGLSKVGL